MKIEVGKTYLLEGIRDTILRKFEVECVHITKATYKFKGKELSIEDDSVIGEGCYSFKPKNIVKIEEVVK